MAPIRPQLLVSHANHSATETSLCVCVSMCVYVCMYMHANMYACMYMCVYIYFIACLLTVLSVSTSGCETGLAVLYHTLV